MESDDTEIKGLCEIQFFRGWFSIGGEGNAVGQIIPKCEDQDEEGVTA
jgi:hypothetical protein